MPASTSAIACALCGASYTSYESVSYHLTATDGGYQWTRDGVPVVTATPRHGAWNVVGEGGAALAVTVTVDGGDRDERVSLVDQRSGLGGTLAASDRGGFVVCDDDDRVVMAVRADGPSGLHLVDAEGYVLALASRPGGRRRHGLDLLVTTRGNAGPESLVFGVSLALELLAGGPAAAA